MKYSNETLNRLDELDNRLSKYDKNNEVASKMAAILKQSAGLVMEVTIDGKISFCAAGYSQDEFIDGKEAIGKTIEEAFTNGLVVPVLNTYRKSVETKRKVKTSISHGPKDNPRTIQIRALPSGSNIVILIRDVTEED